MKFSLAYEMQRPTLDDHAVIEETIEQCILADEMGFDAVWFVEHHFLTTFSGSPCPEVIFGALSRLTKNIRLGFGVVILPYHHPVRVAERVAMVDQLSHGRVDFGTGRSAPYEQMGMGIDPRDTREMWEESLNMVPKIWESDFFEWEGKYWNVPSSNLGGRVTARHLPTGCPEGHRRHGLGNQRSIGAGARDQSLPGGHQKRESRG